MIPSFDLKRQYALLQEEIEGALLRVSRSGHYIMGDEVAAFEKQCAEFLSVTHALGVASGSDALLLGLMAAGVGPGDEVLVPPFTFFATAGCVVRLGAKPVFVDVCEDTYNMDPALLERAITSKTKAIIPVHLYGQMCDMIAISAIAKKHNLFVLEDAAQAIGATYDGKGVGELSDVGAYSFFPTKNLGALGDGGLVTTNDEIVFRTIDMLRKHGAEKKYYHDLVGLNSRLDALHAAVLGVKLHYLERFIARRQEIAALYTKGLSDVTQVVVPAIDPKAFHVFHQYTIACERRDELQAFLSKKGIGAAVYYPLSLHEQPCFAEQKPSACPVSSRLASRVLSLPLFPELTDAEVKTVIDAIRGFYV